MQMKDISTSTLSDRYEGREIDTMWLKPDLATTFGVTQITVGDPGVSHIVIKAGWVLIVGGGGRQRWINPDDIAAFELVDQGGVTL